jgi:hypothetical protein
MDINGQVITQSDIEGFRDYHLKIGNNVSAGVYLVQIKTNSGTFYKRLLIN